MPALAQVENQSEANQDLPALAEALWNWPLTAGTYKDACCGLAFRDGLMTSSEERRSRLRLFILGPTKWPEEQGYRGYGNYPFKVPN